MSARRRALLGGTAAAVLALGGGLWSLSAADDQGSASPLSTRAAAAAPQPKQAAAALPECLNRRGVASLLVPTSPIGPASDAITYQRVSKAFSLGDGMFVADPPPDVTPAVTAAQAGCQLASSFTSYGWPAGPGRLALASVTLRPKAGSPVPAYRHQLAWILVAAANEPAPAGCPMREPGPRPTPSAPANPYEVYLLDAMTATPQILYEDNYVVCDTYTKGDGGLDFLSHVESVPWTVASRSADGATVTVTAQWNSCQRFRGIVGPGGELKAAATQDSPTEIDIEVDGPTGPRCGDPSPHPVIVGPKVAGAALSTTLRHAPVGLLGPA